MTQQRSGAQLLDAVLAAIRKHVILPSDHALIAVVLWVAATHAQAAWNNATRLAISSPEKRCGKSRLMEILAAMCHRVIMTANISTAALFRVIELEPLPPTVLLDEADTIFGTKIKAELNEDLRGLLNAGYARDLPSIRCVGPTSVPTEFKNYAMAALAGIGELPDTITDRAVNVTMRRRMVHETVDPYRARRDGPVLHQLREELAQWLEPHLDALQAADPDLPLEDRAADNWVSLVAVADLAGGAWPKLARSAATVLTAQQADNESRESLNVQLLRDIAGVWKLNSADFIGSGELVMQLRSDESAPWNEVDLTARKLATRLNGFEVKSERNTAGKARGYRRNAFNDAFERYLETSGSPDLTTQPHDQVSLSVKASETTPDLHEQSDTSQTSDTSKCQTDSIRQNVSAGQAPNLTLRHFETDTAGQVAGEPEPCPIHGIKLTAAGKCSKCCSNTASAKVAS